jgi:hypothetical protein
MKNDIGESKPIQTQFFPTEVQLVVFIPSHAADAGIIES